MQQPSWTMILWGMYSKMKKDIHFLHSLSLSLYIIVPFTVAYAFSFIQNAISVKFQAQYTGLVFACLVKCSFVGLNLYFNP